MTKKSCKMSETKSLQKSTNVGKNNNSLANVRERGRTQSVNGAFIHLRGKNLRLQNWLPKNVIGSKFNLCLALI